MTTPAFVTGSYAYGVPRVHPEPNPSDLDLVVYVEYATAALFAELFNGDADKLFRYPGSVCIYLNPDPAYDAPVLNLVMVYDHALYEAWAEGTQILKERKPVTREEAIQVLRECKRDRGLWDEGIALR